MSKPCEEICGELVFLRETLEEVQEENARLREALQRVDDETYDWLRLDEYGGTIKVCVACLVPKVMKHRDNCPFAILES